MLGSIIYKMKYRAADPMKRARLAAERYGFAMGDDCHFFGSADFGSEPYLVSLGNQVYLSDNIRFATHDGGVRVLDNLGLLSNGDVFGRIRVGSNVFIGMNTIVLRNTIIGDNVVVGAGSVVTGTLESGYVYAGVPARRIKSIDEYADRLKPEALRVYGIEPAEKERIIRAWAEDR